MDGGGLGAAVLKGTAEMMTSQRRHADKPTVGRLRGLPMAFATLGVCAAVAACGSNPGTTSNTGRRGIQPAATPPETDAGITTTSLVNGKAGPPPGRSYVSPATVGKLSEVPVSTGPGASTSAVSVIRPDSSTLADLGLAFQSYELLQTCTVDTVDGTVHVAKVDATDVRWAVAGLKPGPDCQVLHDGRPIDPTKYGIFQIVPPPPVGVFEQQPGQSWMMTTETGKPFPCPALPGKDPLVPDEVLKAWQIPYYSPSCIALAPQGPP